MKKATGQAAVVGVGGNRKGKQQKANEGRRKEEKGKQVGRVAPLRVVLSDCTALERQLLQPQCDSTH